MGRNAEPARRFGALADRVVSTISLLAGFRTPGQLLVSRPAILYRFVVERGLRKGPTNHEQKRYRGSPSRRAVQADMRVGTLP